MKFNLAKDKLSQYVVTNIAYYEKFLEKFNQKGSFLSWNWAALLIPYIYSAYRKMWGVYLLLIIFNIIIVSLFYILYQDDFRNTEYLIYFSVMVIVAGSYVQYFALRANAKFLKKAYLSKEQMANNLKVHNGRSRISIVVLTALVFLTPNIIIGYQLVTQHKLKNVKLTVQHLSLQHDRGPEVLRIVGEMIDSIDDKNINISDLNGHTAVYNTVCYDSPEIIKRLNEKGADLTPDSLLRAAICNAPNVVNYLIENNIRVQNDKKYLLICTAIFKEQLALVKALLQNDHDLSTTTVCEDTQSSFLELALRVEDKNKRQILLGLLLSKGADLNYYNPTRGESALSFAVNNNDINTVKYMLAKSKNPEKISGESWILRYALKHPIEMMKLLLDSKIDPNTEYSDGENILTIAIQEKRVEFIKLLLSYGAVITPEALKRAHDTNDQNIIKILE